MSLDISLRIKQLRTEKKLTQKAFCEKLEIKQSNLSHIENNGKKISIEIVQKIISYFNINADWLILGMGDMYNKIPYKINDDVIESVSEADNALKYEYESLKDKYIRLNEQYNEQITRAKDEINTYLLEISRLKDEIMLLKSEKTDKNKLSKRTA